MMEANLSMKSSGKPLARTSNLESLKIKETELSQQNFLGKYFFFKNDVLYVLEQKHSLVPVLNPFGSVKANVTT